MDNEKLYLELENKEEQFLYNEGFNKGFTMFHKKVARCLLLSSNSKILYQLLLSYAKGGGGESFPSHARLMLELDWTKPTLLNYMKELEDKGFILIQANSGYANHYLFPMLHKNGTILHSETLFMIQKKLLSKYSGLNFQKLLKKYRESEHFKVVVSQPELRVTIESWFTDEIEGIQPKIDTQLCYMHGVEPPKPSRRVVSYGDYNVERSNSTDVKAPKKKQANYLETSIDDWNTVHFHEYFSHLYKEKYNLPYMPKNMIQDRSALKVLIELYNDNKMQLKEHMETFFKSDVFKHKKITVFRSAWVQQKLNELKNGSKNTSSKKSSEIGDSAYDEWYNSLGLGED